MLSQVMYLSKVTAGSLEDRDYVVDPSAVSGLDIVCGRAVSYPGASLPRSTCKS